MSLKIRMVSVVGCQEEHSEETESNLRKMLEYVKMKHLAAVEVRSFNSDGTPQKIKLGKFLKIS